MIPDEAVEAAARLIREKSLHSNYYPTHDAIVAILEAAAPHLMAAAWERGYLFSYYQERGWTDDGTARAPEHLVEYLAEWNPHKKEETK